MKPPIHVLLELLKKLCNRKNILFKIHPTSKREHQRTDPESIKLRTQHPTTNSLAIVFRRPSKQSKLYHQTTRHSAFNIPLAANPFWCYLLMPAPFDHHWLIQEPPKESNFLHKLPWCDEY